jgi:hypothetical protein
MDGSAGEIAICHPGEEGHFCDAEDPAKTYAYVSPSKKWRC